MGAKRKGEGTRREHTLTLDTVRNLGYIYHKQGKPGEAEKMFKWALQGSEKALSVDHTSTLDTIDNLGYLFWKQGKLRKARDMFERARQGHRAYVDTQYG
jgi:Tfp pilus assembly protein PilF